MIATGVFLRKRPTTTSTEANAMMVRARALTSSRRSHPLVPGQDRAGYTRRLTRLGFLEALSSPSSDTTVGAILAYDADNRLLLPAN